MNEVIRTEKINKVYRTGDEDLRVLKDVDLCVRENEYVAVLGPSGSGKSTLMNIIGCLDGPTSGSYLLDGEDVLQSNDDRLAEIRNRKIGFIFQKFNLMAKYTALQNVMIPLLYRGIPEDECSQKAKEQLERLGMGDRLEHYPSQLSGGQQQRVAIARAIAGDPPLLLADEPTGNLDSRSGEEVMKIFNELHQKGNTIIIITHDREIADAAPRTVFIRDGVLTEMKGEKGNDK